MNLVQKAIAVVALICFAHLSYSQAHKKFHLKSLVVDTHNDILTECFDKHLSFDDNLLGKTHSDIARFKQGGVDAQIFSIWCDGEMKQPFNYANTQIDTLFATLKRNPSTIALVTSSIELKKAVKDKKLAAMIGVEGGHMIQDDLDKLDSLYKRGVRYMTLTWNNSTPWATSAMFETTDSTNAPKGLNDFGKQVVKRMNALGMMIDISHVGEKTFYDVIAATTRPVIASHSSAYALAPVFRNLKDDQISTVAKNGGVIHVNFYSGFLDSNFSTKDHAFQVKHKVERDSLLLRNPEPHFANAALFKKYANEVEDMKAPLSLLIDHIDHIVKIAGIDHVGIGSDFDGINSTPKELFDVTTYPLVTEALLQRGYSKKDVRKILGLNFLRVLMANEK
ncbi:MAG: dipeptidase [Ginsengibacter sp.]